MSEVELRKLDYAVLMRIYKTASPAIRKIIDKLIMEAYHAGY